MRVESRTDWKRLRTMKDEEIDFSDIPPISRTMLKNMVIRMPRRKSLVSLRIDPDVVEWFKSKGKGYQTRINALLRAYVDAHSH